MNRLTVLAALTLMLGFIGGLSLTVMDHAAHGWGWNGPRKAQASEASEVPNQGAASAKANRFEETRLDAPTLKDLRDGQCSEVWGLERLSDGKVYVWAKYHIESEPSIWLSTRICRKDGVYFATPLTQHASINQSSSRPSDAWIPVTVEGEIR